MESIELQSNLKMYMFRTHLPGQNYIQLFDSSPERAYKQLIDHLQFVYPDPKEFRKAKSQINLFPITQDEYYQNEAIEPPLVDIPSRRIKLSQIIKNDLNLLVRS